MANITLETALDAFDATDLVGVSDTQKNVLQQAAEALALGPDVDTLEKVETTLSQIESVQNASGVIDKYATSASAAQGAIEKATDAVSTAQGSIKKATDATSAVPGAIKEKATEIVEPMSDEVSQAQQDEIVKAQQYEEGLQRERKDLKDASLLDEDEEQKTNQITNKNPSSGEFLLSADKPADHDHDLFSSCVVCNNQEPCIEKLVVKCHDGKNTRVSLKGEFELEKTNGRIYFVADQFESGKPTFENFLNGARLYDPTEIEVTIKGSCYHKYHAVRWTDSEDGVVTAAPGKTTTLKFRPMTKRISHKFAFANRLHTSVLASAFPKQEIAFEVLSMMLNILFMRPNMTNEQKCYITYDGFNSFAFTSVTVPLLQIRGNVALRLPALNIKRLKNKEGKASKNTKGMKNRVREAHTKQWGVGADLDISIGNYKDTIKIGDYDKTTKTWHSKASLRKEKAKKQKKSGFTRFLSAITDSGAILVGKMTPEASKKPKLVEVYSDGPEVQLALGPDQQEEENGPKMGWNFNFGLSLYYLFGVKFNIYEALLIAAKASPAPQAKILVKSLEELQEGIHWWFIDGEVTPELYLELSLAVEPKPSQAGPTDDFLSVTLNLITGKFEKGVGRVTIAGAVKAGGGISGYFDTIFTAKTVFDYSAEIVTKGGVTIQVDKGGKDSKKDGEDKNGQKDGDDKGRWRCGYQIWHNGVVLNVIAVKKVKKEDSTNVSRGGGKSKKSITIETKEDKKWAKNGEGEMRSHSASYRLADKDDGVFIPFG